MSCASCPRIAWSKTLQSHYCKAKGMTDGLMTVATVYSGLAQECQKRPKDARGGVNRDTDTGKAK